MGGCTMAKFIRTEEHQKKLFEKALFDDKHVIQDATIRITYERKAYCEDSDTYLSFPRNLREYGNVYTADVYGITPKNGIRKYYKAVKGSIRKANSDEIVG